jgi:hypothetical protein
MSAAAGGIAGGAASAGFGAAWVAAGLGAAVVAGRFGAGLAAGGFFAGVLVLGSCCARAATPQVRKIAIAKQVEMDLSLNIMVVSFVVYDASSCFLIAVRAKWPVDARLVLGSLSHNL